MTASSWIASLDSISDEPLRRAAQIALAAIDSYLSDEDGDGASAKLETAYEELQTALAHP